MTGNRNWRRCLPLSGVVGLFVACGPEPSGESPSTVVDGQAADERSARLSDTWLGSDDPCDYDWDYAPCGSSWAGRYWCDPCDVTAYVCGSAYADDPVEWAWNRTGVACGCVDEEGLIKKIPECSELSWE